MTSVTIIVSHYESPEFLTTCIRQIKKHANPSIKQEVIIADQSGDQTHATIVEEFFFEEDVRVIRMKDLWSGYGVDYCLRYADIKTEYVAQMHVDCIPISNQWLKLPIKLIEEDGFTFVGQMQLISLPTDTIYPPGKFF